MRSRNQTLGSLGRTRGARPPVAPVPPPPPDDDRRGDDDAAPEPGAIRRFLRGALVDNIGLKGLSLVLAVTVFLMVNTDADRQITVRADVKYEYPDDKVLVSEPVKAVSIEIKGAWRRLRRFDEREIKAITLNLPNASTGDVAITPDMVTSLPPGLVVKSISPSSVRVAFEKRIEKLVEVVPTLAGRPEHGYVVAEVKAVPATVKVRGAEGLLATMPSIATEGVALAGHTESFKAEVGLAPRDGVAVDADQHVQVLVRIDEELVTRKVPDIAVVVRGEGVDPARWAVHPPQVEITLTGALLAVEKARASLAPIVTLSATDARAREAEVTLEGLPPGVGVRRSPERVKVVPVAPPKP